MTTTLGNVGVISESSFQLTRGSISGVIRDADGDFASRRVLLMDRFGTRIAESISKASDGFYEMKVPFEFFGAELNRVAFSAGDDLYNDLIDRVIPT